LRDGTFADEPPLQSVPGAERVVESPVLRFSMDGEIVDTIVIRTHPHRLMRLDLQGEPILDLQPFTDDAFWTVSPSRMELVVVDRALPPEEPSLGVTKLSVAGDSLWHRRYPVERAPLERSAVESYRLKRAKELTDFGFAMSRRHAATAIREAIFVPEHMPASFAAHIGRDGSVWVGLAGPDPDASRWLVLRANGDILGELTLPSRFVVLYATEASVWGMERDAMDVPYIVQYAVRGGGEL
jgi:hypothetical protein